MPERQLGEKEEAQLRAAALRAVGSEEGLRELALKRRAEDQVSPRTPHVRAGGHAGAERLGPRAGGHSI